MQNGNPESSTLFWKVAIYVGGFLIGISAKIATLFDKDELSLKKFILHSTLALSSAWIVYFVLDAKGYSSWMPVAGPLIGRFGDHILIAIWKIVKEKIISSARKEIEE